MNQPVKVPTSFILDVLRKNSELLSFCYSLSSNTFLFISEAFSTILPSPIETALKNPDAVFKVIHPDDAPYILKSLNELKNETKKQDLQFRLLLPQQRIKWISLNASLVDYEGIEVIIGTAQDITAQKDYSDTLHKFSHKKNSVLTMVSHDLLGPLNNIQLIVGLLEGMAILKDNVQVNRLLHLTHQSSQRSIDIIRDLISQEFLESSEAHLNKQRIDVILSLRTLIDQYIEQESLALKTFTLRCDLQTLFISIDESKFIQVINNLISNAIKFTKDYGVIDIEVVDFDNQVLFKITDNGIGIPGDLQPFLFDKFTKARRLGLLGETSVGLGMSIIQTIIGWHDGRIWFESKEGSGTTFFIEIPK